MSAQVFDVLAVNLRTNVVRLIDDGKTESDAEAIVKMAVMRRGVEVEFFTAQPAGIYRDGDIYGTRA